MRLDLPIIIYNTRESDAMLYHASLRIQIDHDCRNSVTFRFKAKFEAFLRASHENSPTLPNSLDALAAAAGIHTVIAPGDNLKGGVFVPWRVALYVAGDEASVKNALMLLDSFFQREIRPVNGEAVTINVHPHKGIDVEGVKEDIYVRLHYILCTQHIP